MKQNPAVCNHYGSGIFKRHRYPLANFHQELLKLIISEPTEADPISCPCLCYCRGFSREPGSASLPGEALDGSEQPPDSPQGREHPQGSQTRGFKGKKKKKSHLSVMKYFAVEKREFAGNRAVRTRLWDLSRLQVQVHSGCWNPTSPVTSS